MGMIFGFVIMLGIGFVGWKIYRGDIPLKEKINVVGAVEYVEHYTWGERGERFKGVPLIKGEMGEDSMYELVVGE